MTSTLMHLPIVSYHFPNTEYTSMDSKCKKQKCYICQTEDTTKKRKLACECTHPLCDDCAKNTVKCKHKSGGQQHGQHVVTMSQCERCPKGTLKDTTLTRDIEGGNSCDLCYECAKGSRNWVVFCKGKNREVVSKHQN